MSEWAGGKSRFFRCDTCGQETEHEHNERLFHDFPPGWYHASFGNGEFVESTTTIHFHFCSREHLIQWLALSHPGMLADLP